jgi:hypothetical protein
VVLLAGNKDLELIVWDEGGAGDEGGTCLGEAIIDTDAWVRGGTYQLTQVREGGAKVLVSTVLDSPPVSLRKLNGISISSNGGKLRFQLNGMPMHFASML